MNQTGPPQICAQGGHTWSHSDHLLSVHQAPRPPSGPRSWNFPLGISTWMLQRRLKFPRFKTRLLFPPATPASHLPFTHQVLTLDSPSPSPHPRCGQFHTCWLCHLYRLLPDTSPEDETAPLPFSPPARATVKCKRFLAENQSIGS